MIPADWKQPQRKCADNTMMGVIFSDHPPLWPSFALSPKSPPTLHLFPLSFPTCRMIKKVQEAGGRKVHWEGGAQFFPPSPAFSSVPSRSEAYIGHTDWSSFTRLEPLLCGDSKRWFSSVTKTFLEKLGKNWITFLRCKIYSVSIFNF